jgi:ribosomal protein S18 acetylase RimI-like enzyme
MAIRIEDWRAASVDRVAPLYQAEIRRWDARLGWDATSMCTQVELGRRAGTVDGVMLSDESGYTIGWAFYLLHRSSLQVGGFMSTSGSATERMLDVIVGEAAGRAASLTFFVMDGATDLIPALRRRGLALERYLYLSRTLSGVQTQSDAAGQGYPRSVPSVIEVLDHRSDSTSDEASRGADGIEPAAIIRPWRAGDLGQATELLAKAYPGADEARPFASHGSWHEWLEYLSQLTETDGCGALLPEGCFATTVNERLAALALTSRISEETGHLSQLAVDPDVRGRGLGHALLAATCASAQRAGCRRLTLLVSSGNAAARRLYARAGFDQVAGFVAAGSFQPRRLMRCAPAGEVRARR